MRFSNIAMVAGATVASAQRPSNTPICDYYTKALLKENTAANQMTLLTLVVNTAVIGNYTKPNVGIKVDGILAPGKVNDTDVNLLPYFNGDLKSSNRGGKTGVSVNFLDGGGAAPLMKSKPADNNSSNQYALLTHLYEFFGSLLGCSMQGMSGFDAYSGDASMYEVHKFMDLSYAEMTYFITQVANSAASFGVAKDDLTVVGNALNTIFNVRCAPAAAAVKAQGPQLQSICIDPKTCPQAPMAQCGKYETPMEPQSASGSNSTATMSSGSSPTGSSGSGSGSGTGSSPTTSPSSVSTGAASANGLSFAALAVGIAAFAL